MSNDNLLTLEFSKGINEYKDETLLGFDEASAAQNVDIDSGVLSTIKGANIYRSESGIVRMAKFCKGGSSTLMTLKSNSDYLNYQIGNTEVMLLGDGISPVQVYDGYSYRNIRNRRVQDIESLSIPERKSYMICSVGGGSVENSIKIWWWTPPSRAEGVYLIRSSDTIRAEVGDEIPYHAIPYKSETDILETYSGENIMIFSTTMKMEDPSNNYNYKYFDHPMVGTYTRFTVQESMITKKVITPTTFTEDIPKGSFLELNHERVWLAGDVDNPNRLYFSKDFDIDDWTIPIEEGEANQHGGLIDFPTWDSGKIIGLKVLYGDLFVFKERHIFRVFGTYPGNYQAEKIFSITGTMSDRSIVAGPNSVYFASKEGIYAFNGNTAALISQKIKKTWSTINKDYLKNAVGIFYKNKYFLAVPEGGSTVNNLIIEYNTENNTFVFIRGLTVNDFIELDGSIYFSNATGVYKMFQSDSLNTGYEATWTSGKMNFGACNSIKTTQKIYFLGSGAGSVRISIENHKKKVKTIEIPLTSEEKYYRKRLKNKGRTLKFSISSVNGSRFKLKDLQITYEEDVD